MALQSQLQLFQLCSDAIVNVDRADSWPYADRTRFEAAFTSCSRGSPTTPPAVLPPHTQILHSASGIHSQRKVIVLASYTSSRSLILQLVRISEAGDDGISSTTGAAGKSVNLQTRVFPWLPDVDKEVTGMCLCPDGSVLAACTADGSLYLLPVLLLMTFERARPFHPIATASGLPSLAAMALHKLQINPSAGPVPSDVWAMDDDDGGMAADALLGLPTLLGCAVCVPVQTQLAPTAGQGPIRKGERGLGHGAVSNSSKPDDERRKERVCDPPAPDVPTCCTWWTPTSTALQRELKAAEQVRRTGPSASSEADEEAAEQAAVSAPFSAAEGCFVMLGYGSGRVTIVDVSSSARHVAWSAPLDPGHAIHSLSLFNSLPQLSAAGLWSLPAEYRDPAAFRYSEEGKRGGGAGANANAVADEFDLAVTHPFPAPLALPTTSLVVRTSRRYMRMALEKPMPEDVALEGRKAQARRMRAASSAISKMRKKRVPRDSAAALPALNAPTSSTSRFQSLVNLVSISTRKPGRVEGSGDPEGVRAAQAGAGGKQEDTTDDGESSEVTSAVDTVSSGLPTPTWTCSLIDVTGEIAVNLMRAAQADGESETGLGQGVMAGLDASTAASLLQIAARSGSEPSGGAPGGSDSDRGSMQALTSYANNAAVYSRPGVIMYVPVPGEGVAVPWDSAPVSSTSGTGGQGRQKRRGSIAASVLGYDFHPTFEAADPGRLLPSLPATFAALPAAWRPRPLTQSPARCDIAVQVSARTRSCLISVFYFASDDKLLLFDPALGEAPLYELTIATRPSALRAGLARVAYSRLRSRVLGPMPRAGALAIQVVEGGRAGAAEAAHVATTSSAGDTAAKRVRYGSSRVVLLDEERAAQEKRRVQGGTQDDRGHVSMADVEDSTPVITLNLRACTIVWADGLLYVAENPTAPDLDESEVTLLQEHAEVGGSGADAGEVRARLADIGTVTGITGDEAGSEPELDGDGGSIGSAALEGSMSCGSVGGEDGDSVQGAMEEEADETANTGQSGGAVTVVVMPRARPPVPVPIGKRTDSPSRALTSPGGAGSAAMRYGRSTGAVKPRPVTTSAQPFPDDTTSTDPLLPRISISSDSSWEAARPPTSSILPASSNLLLPSSSRLLPVGRARLLVVSTNVACRAFRDAGSIDSAVKMVSSGLILPGAASSDSPLLPAPDTLVLPSDSVLETFELPVGEVILGMDRVIPPGMSTGQSGKPLDPNTSVLALMTSAGVRLLIPQDISQGQALLSRLIDSAGIGWPEGNQSRAHAQGTFGAEGVSIAALDRLAFALGLSVCEAYEESASTCLARLHEQSGTTARARGAGQGAGRQGAQAWPEALPAALCSGRAMAGLNEAGTLDAASALAFRAFSLFSLAGPHPLRPIHVLADAHRPDLAVAYALRALAFGSVKPAAPVRSAGELAGFLPPLPLPIHLTGSLSPSDRVRISNLTVQCQLLCPRSSVHHYGLTLDDFCAFLASNTDYTPETALARCLAAGAIQEVCAIGLRLTRLDAALESCVRRHGTACIVQDKELLRYLGSAGAACQLLLQPGVSIGCLCLREALLADLSALLILLLHPHISSQAAFLRLAGSCIMPRVHEVRPEQREALVHALEGRPDAPTHPGDDVPSGMLFNAQRVAILQSKAARQVIAAQLNLRARSDAGSVISGDEQGDEEGGGDDEDSHDVLLLSASFSAACPDGSPGPGNACASHLTRAAHECTELYLLLTVGGRQCSEWVSALCRYAAWYRPALLTRRLLDAGAWEEAALVMEQPYTHTVSGKARAGEGELVGLMDGQGDAHVGARARRTRAAEDAFRARLEGLAMLVGTAEAVTQGQAVRAAMRSLRLAASLPLDDSPSRDQDVLACVQTDRLLLQCAVRAIQSLIVWRAALCPSHSEGHAPLPLTDELVVGLLRQPFRSLLGAALLECGSGEEDGIPRTPARAEAGREGMLLALQRVALPPHMLLEACLQAC